MGLSVHPRACGEQVSQMKIRILDDGSSPRLRGTGRGCVPRRQQRRFIPAPAGNRDSGSLCSLDRAVHPRACGEQPTTRCSLSTCRGSSPRLRGTGGTSESGTSESGFIPAPAGNRPRGQVSRIPPAVHPRACGEQLDVPALHINDVGSSPRLRGTACRSRATTE